MSDEAGVRSALRAAILRGDLAPRQRLVEVELAEQYGSSRFVVRNVLLHLEGEGLVELQPNRGARVREVPVGEAIEITEVRRVLEGLVAARAAERATPDDRREMGRLGDAMRTAVRAGDLAAYSAANADLHAALRRIAGHATAEQILDRLNGQLVRHQFRLALVPGRAAVSLGEHVAIADAVRTGDGPAAEQAMHAHLDSVIAALAAFR